MVLPYGFLILFIYVGRHCSRLIDGLFCIIQTGSYISSSEDRQASNYTIAVGAICIMMRAGLTLSIGFLASISAAAHAAERRIAVFEFELIDTSLESSTSGPRADEAARLHQVSDQLRQRLAASGRFSVVDIAPVAVEARASHLHGCNGCEANLARKVGADLAITGVVQKVSNLILNMNIYIRDAATGRVMAGVSADLRGNTDETWSRTLDWLVRNRLLAADGGVLP